MTDMAVDAVVDANVILRYLLADVPAQADAAEDMLRGINTGDTRVLCHPVTLAEIVHVLTRTYKLPPADTVEHLWPLILAPGFLVPDKSLYASALKLFATSVPHFGDACACAAALEEAEGRLYSFDKKLSRVEGVTRLERPRKQ